MSKDGNALPTPHPFMANTAPGSFQEMLRVAKVNNIEELFEQIPQDHKFTGEWNFDSAIPSEASLYKHLTGILRKNRSYFNDSISSFSEF